MIKALRADNGKLVWEKSRPRKPNYSSPIILNVGGKDQLLMTGCDLVTSIDPTSGKLLWEIPGATTECVTSSVTDGKHIFTSGGYPKNHLAAVVADGSGKIAWENNSRHYVPSLVHSGGYLFWCDGCWHCRLLRQSNGRNTMEKPSPRRFFQLARSCRKSLLCH